MSTASRLDGFNCIAFCELCCAPFKIGGTAGHPKYGHCFCGAAYHKDCFETLAQDDGRGSEGGGKCVRCGKKLKIAMDARSEAIARGVSQHGREPGIDRGLGARATVLGPALDWPWAHHRDALGVARSAARGAPDLRLDRQRLLVRDRHRRGAAVAQ